MTLEDNERRADGHVVEIASQEPDEVELGATQLDGHRSTADAVEGIHFGMRNSELEMLDRMMAEQDHADTRHQAQQEFEHEELLATQEAEQAGQWLDAHGVELANRRAQDLAPQAKMDAHAQHARRMMEEMANQSALLYQHKLAQDEVNDFNRRIAARLYKDWEEWAVLNVTRSRALATTPGWNAARSAGAPGRSHGWKTGQVESSHRRKQASGLAVRDRHLGRRRRRSSQCSEPETWWRRRRVERGSAEGRCAAWNGTRCRSTSGE